MRAPIRFFAHGGPRAAMLIALVVALWVAGTLGLVHRTAHGPGVAHGPSEVTASESTDAAEAPGHCNWIDALFGQHHEADCRLYDQLAHGPAALGVPLMVLPLVLPVAVFDFLEGQALARWVALFDARGPPSSR